MSAGFPTSKDAELIALTDQCVMCGLCLPHCPTYGLTGHEAESPRGRIALARWIANDSLEVTPAAKMHLDHCLSCLSCQQVCPSQVRYDEIIVRTRSILNNRVKGRKRRMARFWHDPTWLLRVARLVAFTRAGRWLPALARVLPAHWRITRWLTEIPSVPLPLLALPTSQQSHVLPSRGRIGLFLGCVASVFDRDTHAAIAQILERLGYEVVRPEQSHCCGAIARHAGECDDAERIAAAARAVFTDLDVGTVLVSASGCLASVRDQVFMDGRIRVMEVHAFLAADEQWNRLRFRELSARVALHLPCTQMSVAGGDQAVRQILRSIPGLELLSLPPQPGCCGAAGTYFLEQPEFAQRLRAEKLRQINAQQPDVLLTTNIGCRIYLGNGLRQTAMTLPVLHPVTLLVRQLETYSKF